MDFSYSKPCEYSDMLKQGGCSINPFFPIYKAIFYGYLHNKIMNRQVQQEDWWGVVQSCCLTGSDISQHEAKLEPDIEETVDIQWKTMDSWKLISYKEEHLEKEDMGKILIQLNPPILCHPFLHPFSLVSWELFVWTHKKKINSRHSMA